MMPVQYPNFIADPNSVPKTDPLGNFAKGYKIAMAPKKMRLDMQTKQAALQQLQQQNEFYPKVQQQALDKGAMENEWYPKSQQAALDQQQASTGFLNTENQWYPKTAQASINQSNAATNASNQRTSDAALESQRQQAFYKMLTNGGSPQPQAAPNQASGMGAPQPQYAPGHGNVPYAPQQGGMGAGAPMSQPAQGGAAQYAPASGPQAMPTAAASAPQQSAQIITPGNSNLYHVDDLYDKNPQYKDMFEKQGITKTVKNIPNPKTGQMMTVTTWPSGKQTATSAQIGPSAEDTSFATEMGKKKADSYQKYTDAMSENIRMQSSLDSIKSDIMNPDFTNAVGPANSYLNKMLGSGSASKLMGDITATSKTLQGQVANTVGTGNAAASRLRFAEQMKMDPKDRPDTFVGKTEAMNRMNLYLKDYNAIVAKTLEKGGSQTEALEKAEKSLPWDKYQGNMQKLLDTGKLASQLRDRGMSIQYSNNAPYVKVPSTAGDVYIPVSNYNAYMQDYQNQGATK